MSTVGARRGGATAGLVRPIFFNRVDARESIETKAKDAHVELQGYEAQLAGQPWLVGSALSAADIVVFPQLMGLVRAATPRRRRAEAGAFAVRGEVPQLAAWVARIEALPGYENTYPPHWR